jgi:hypothetical protein
LTDAGHVAVPKDSKDSLNGSLAMSAINCVLMGQEFDDSLSDAHLASCHL